MYLVIGLLGLIFIASLIYGLYIVIRRKVDHEYISFLEVWMVIIICLTAFLSIGIAINKLEGDFQEFPFEPFTVESFDKISKKSQVTLDNFQRIKMGMSYSEVVSILGEEGEEVSRSDFAGRTTASYDWKGENLAIVSVVFQNDSLLYKSQFGLK